MTRQKVLLIEDDAGIRFGITQFLTSKGFTVTEAETCEEAGEKFRAERPDAVISDFRLPDGNALELLPKMKAAGGMPFLILTGHGSIELAVRAIKEGADQFLTKPVELPALLVVLERVLENARARQRELAGKRTAPEELNPFEGQSAAIRALEDRARRLLQSDSPVLIQGETGSGKGVLAQWLHKNGPRAGEPLVSLNCAGLSKEFLESELFGHERGAFTGAVASKPGLLEVAHKGTVFLDEIGDVDPAVQPKLLKVLEDKRFRRMGEVRDRQVDVRLVFASHHDVRLLSQEGRFRADLYFRISTLKLEVPPLRERPEDIGLLADQLVVRLARELGRTHLALAPEAKAALEAYGWPGNIRELRNVLERAVLLGDGETLRASDLGFDAPENLAAELAAGGDAADVHLTLEQLEKLHIRRVLDACDGHVDRAARQLAVPRSTLYQKLKRFGIPLVRGG